MLLEAVTAEELQAFYNKIKNDDIRVQTKLRTVIGYKVKDIEWLDHGIRVFSWDEYYSMVQAEAGLKAMAAIKRVEEEVKKLTADEKPCLTPVNLEVIGSPNPVAFFTHRCLCLKL